MKISAISFGVSNMLQLEHSDCSVRALANTGLMLYPEAHELMRSYGRETGCGLYMQQVFKAYAEAGLEYLGAYGKTGLAQSCRIWSDSPDMIQPKCTLAKFLTQHQEGRYVVYISGHLLAVVDGEIVDTQANSALARVLAAWVAPE